MNLQVQIVIGEGCKQNFTDLGKLKALHFTICIRVYIKQILVFCSTMHAMFYISYTGSFLYLYLKVGNLRATQIVVEENVPLERFTLNLLIGDSSSRSCPARKSYLHSKLGYTKAMREDCFPNWWKGFKSSIGD
jgi:hypothetical protein